MFEWLNSWRAASDPAAEQIVALITAYALRVVAAAVILIVGLWFARWLANFLRRAMTGRRHADPTLVNFFASLVRYLVVAITIIAVLEKFGIQTTSLIAVLGAAGLAIGLALQGTLAHVAAGVMLLIFRPFRVGDRIETKDVTGSVKEITLFFTTLDTTEGVHMIVPNGLLWGQWIRNHSAKAG